MSYNGSGTFNINTAGQPVVTGTVISSTAFNALTADLGTGLSTALTKDGQTVATARIPFAQGINSSLVTDATSTTTGSIITAGGVGIAKALFVGTTANIAGTTTLAGVTATSITDSGLTSGRVTYAGTAGLLQDSANLTFNGTTLTANTIGAFTLGGTVSGGGNQLNNVVIGTTTPLAGAFTTLSASGTITASNATALTVPNGYQTLYRTTNDTSSLLHLQFFRGSGAGAFAGIYTTGDAANGVASLNLNINGTDIAKASSTGLAVTGTAIASTSVGVGNTTPSGGGAGIAFPATQSASTDANTLDDYEEGTWTPTVYFGGATVGVTYTTQSGTYTKVGNIVRLTANITLSNKGSSTTYAEVRGIPFAAPAILGNGAGVVPYYGGMSGLTGTMTVDVYQSTISLRIFGAVQPASVQDTNFTNTSTITFTCTYYV